MPGQGYVNTVTSLDLVTKRYTTLAPMIAARARHATAKLGHKLYVAGGDNNGQDLNSVECFDPTTRVWTTIAPMNKARETLQLVVLAGKLYVIGGYNLSSVECLDLSIPNGQWTPVASMTMPRGGFGAVMAGGKIYAIGGESTSASTSMECFDPNEGPQGQWTITNEELDFVRQAAVIAA